MKSLKDISLPIDEASYRTDGAMHYSTLATYERGGFHSIDTLDERKESESLTFGSIVDCLITGTPEEFEQQYLVADLNTEASDTLINVTKGLFNLYKDSYSTLDEVPNNIILSVLDDINYGKTWKPTTRLDKLRGQCSEYYRLMFLAQGKTIISSDTYNDALACTRALHEAPATKHLFAPNNPFEPEIERLYQLKFSNTFDGIRYSCMADLIYVDHTKKIIIPCDLKTSSHYEDEFYKSFIEWNYSIQARLYANLIKKAIEADDYFKDFRMLNYHFIVVNKKTLNPLVWEFPDTYSMDTLYYGKDKQIECRHPFVIGKELNEYLKHRPSVPNGISISKPNNLKEWLNRI